MITVALPQPRPRTWAAVLRLAFDGDYCVPIAGPAQSKYLAIKRGAVNAILDRLGVDARVGEMRLDIPERFHPLIPPGLPELAVSFVRLDGTDLDPADLGAMLERATP
jgi:hypothetical protein